MNLLILQLPASYHSTGLAICYHKLSIYTSSITKYKFNLMPFNLSQLIYSHSRNFSRSSEPTHNIIQVHTTNFHETR
jgi:hypothetical protein